MFKFDKNQCSRCLRIGVHDGCEYAVVNGYSNYHGYNTSEGCYGTGCLPTAALQEVISHPSYYSPDRAQNERLIDAIEESNEINKEQLKLETENGDEE